MGAGRKVGDGERGVALVVEGAEAEIAGALVEGDGAGRELRAVLGVDEPSALTWAFRTIPCPAALGFNEEFSAVVVSAFLIVRGWLDSAAELAAKSSSPE